MRTKANSSTALLSLVGIFALILMLGGPLPGAQVTAAFAGSKASSTKPQIDFAAVFSRVKGGGNVSPCRENADHYPEFNGLAVDPENGLLVASDTNLKSLLVYRLTDAAANSSEVTRPMAWVRGPNTQVSYAAGVAVDPVRHVFCASENDVGDDVACFPYDAKGDYHAAAVAVPHGAYGVGFSQRRKEMAVAIEHNEQIAIYRTGATGAPHPLREIRGIKTQMADPHGLYWDDVNREIAVVNHGNWSRGYWDADYSGGGRYLPPSITVFADDAKGDVKPKRVIQGSNTNLDWPSGIAVDTVHNEIAVANTGSHSVLIFKRTADGNVRPLRELEGPRTGITVPMGVAFDPVRNTLWVANFGHTILVFDRTAKGNTPAEGIIRNAPRGTVASRFGNPFSLAYDSKRDELLVPN
jgi:DNA-binding beta-propeller fold protein YncE